MSSADAEPELDDEELLELELLEDEELLELDELLEPATPEDELELEELEDDELLEPEEDPPSTGGHSSPGHQVLPAFTV